MDNRRSFAVVTCRTDKVCFQRRDSRIMSSFSVAPLPTRRTQSGAGPVSSRESTADRRSWSMAAASRASWYSQLFSNELTGR